MIENIIKEEGLSKKTLSLGIIKRFLLFHLPFILLFTYAFLLRSFISLGYFCFAIFLFYFEVEKHYSKKNNITSLPTSKFTRMRDLFQLKNYTIFIYYLLLLFTLSAYIWKFLVILFYISFESTFESIIASIDVQNFEIYMLKDGKTINMEKTLLLMLPNLGVLILTAMVILFKAYLENIRMTALGNFRGLFLSKYLFIASATLFVSVVVLTEVSLTGLVLVAVIALYFIFWGSFAKSKTDFFYIAAKVTQLLVIVLWIVQYSLSIETIRNVFNKSEVWNFNFLGIIDMNNLSSQTIMYIVALFLLLGTVTFYADVKKSSDIILQYAKSTGKDLQNESSFLFHSQNVSLSNSQVFDEGDSEPRQPPTLKEILEGNQQKKESSEQSKSSQLQPSFWKRLFTKISKALTRFVRTFQKINFSLRILQVAAIIVAFRCPTVFAVPSILWLFITSFTYNVFVIHYITIFLGLPASIATFFAQYWAAIPDNKLTPDIPIWLGNIQKLDWDPYWLDFIFTFFLLILYCNFLRQVKGAIESRQQEQSALITATFNFRKFGDAFLALILKGAFYFSLAGLYLIGTSKVSIFNTILVGFFIAFFVSEQAARKRWIWLLLVTIIIIFSRYIWVLGFFTVAKEDEMDSVLKRTLSLLGIVDIEDTQNVPLKGNEEDQNQWINFYFWVMFLFVLLQYDVYRTADTQKSGLEIISQTDLMKKYKTGFGRFVKTLNCLFYQGFIWFGYAAITIILSLKDFNILNMFQMLLLFMIFSLHLQRLRNNPEAAHKGVYHIWGFFIILSTVVLSLKYVYSFTTFDFLNKYVLEGAKVYSILNFMVNQSKLIGFYFHSNLQTRLISDILILVISVSMREIFQMYKLFYESKEDSENRRIEDQEDVVQRRDSMRESFIRRRNRTMITIYHKYMERSILDEWPILKRLLEIISYYFSIAIFIYVSLLAGLYRLSFGFFFMLLIYCYYFSRVNSAAIKIFKERNISSKIHHFTSLFKKWYSSENKQKEKLNLEGVYNKKDGLVFDDFVRITLSWRFTVWNYVFILSVILFTLCYICRIFSFPFLKTFGVVIPEIRYYSIRAAFLTGVYAENFDFFGNVYPYLLLIIFSIMELKLAQLLQERIHERLVIKQEEMQQMSAQIRIDNQNNGRVVEEERKEDEFEKKNEALISSENTSFNAAGNRNDSHKEKKSLMNYYRNNFDFLKMKTFEGVISIIAKLVVFMMLINAIDTNNMFGIIYFVAALLAWREILRSDISIMVKITNFGIILLLVQYFLLLFNFNESTSPVDLPTEIKSSSISLLAIIFGREDIMKNQWIKTLGFGDYRPGFKSSDTENMIGDCVIFIIIQLFVWIYVLRAEYILNKLAQRLVLDKADSPEIRSTNIAISQSYSYICLKWIVHNSTVNSPRIAVVIMTIICLQASSFSNIILIGLLLLNIILMDFVLINALPAKKMEYSRNFFGFIQSIIVLFLLFFIIDNLPLEISPLYDFDRIFVDKIIVFTILQVVLDLVSSGYYQENYLKAVKKDSLRGRLAALCITYKFNDNKIYVYMTDYIEKLKLDEKLERVSSRINKWHDQFFEDTDPNSQQKRLANQNVSTLSNREGVQSSFRQNAIEGKESDNRSRKSSPRKSTGDAKPFLTKLKIHFVRWLKKIENSYLFVSNSQLFGRVLEKNKNIVPEEMKNKDCSSQEKITKNAECLDFIEKFYQSFETESENHPKNLSVNEHGPALSREVSSDTERVVGVLENEQSPYLQHENVDLSSPEIVQTERMRRHTALEKSSLLQIVSLLFKAIFSYWQYFCYFVLIIYQIKSQGLFGVVISFAIFGYALTEETRPSFKLWTFLFSFISLITFLKFLANYFQVAKNSFLRILTGTDGSVSFEVILIIMILIQLSFYKRSGFDAGSETSVENVNQAFIRKKINNDFRGIKRKLREKNNAERNSEFLSSGEKQKDTSVDQVIDDVEKDFMMSLSKFTSKDHLNYFFRLFSSYNKKVGIEVYPFIALVQFMIAIYILAFYSSVENGNISESITSSFSFNEFSGPMVIALFAHFAVILLDRRIVLINNKTIKTDEEITEIEQPQEVLEEVPFEDEERKEQEGESINPASPDESSKSKEKTNNRIQSFMNNLAQRFTSTSVQKEAYHPYPSFRKYILQISLLIILNIFLYWYLPGVQSSDSVPLSGTATIFFYLFFATYFTLSALQLKYGIPEFKGKLIITQYYNTYSGIAFKVYRAIPFFFEIKTFMDWTFTDTALDLFQWLKLEDVYGKLYTTKIDSDNQFRKKLGQKVPIFSKCTLGCTGIIFLLLLILGPLLLFSTYNPLASENYVLGATVSMSFQIGNNSFSIFQNSHASVFQSVDPSQSSLFQDQPALRDVDLSRIQTVRMAPFSEQTWSITPPNYDLFKSSVKNISTMLNQSRPLPEIIEKYPSSIDLDYQFFQYQTQKNNIVPTPKTVSYSLFYTPDVTILNTTFSTLLSILTNCSSSQFTLMGFYDSLLRLGIQQSPRNVSLGPNFFKDVTLQLICPSKTNMSDDNIINSYWKVSTENSGKTTEKGLEFFTITNNVSSFLTSFSIQAFYVTIVLVIGNYVRTAFSGQIQYLTLSDLPAAGEILQLCEGILIARSDKNLVREERLYWELVDILRSPEILKLITKSAVKEKMKISKKKKND